jgi:hypothetical protein
MGKNTTQSGFCRHNDVMRRSAYCSLVSKVENIILNIPPFITEGLAEIYQIFFPSKYSRLNKINTVLCPGQNERIAPLSFLHGCRKRLLKD